MLCVSACVCDRYFIGKLKNWPSFCVQACFHLGECDKKYFAWRINNSSQEVNCGLVLASMDNFLSEIGTSVYSFFVL